MILAYISAGSVVVGLLVAALVFLLAKWLLGEVKAPRPELIAAILAILVFVGIAFGW